MHLGFYTTVTSFELDLVCFHTGVTVTKYKSDLLTFNIFNVLALKYTSLTEAKI